MSWDIKETCEALKTQDNRATANPIFVVQQKRRNFGYDKDHADNFVYFEDGETITDPDRLAEIETERKIKGYTNTKKSYYIDRWEFVTACLTENGCLDYIRQNGHNLKEPRIYVESGYRNDEWMAVREHFKAIV